MCLPDTPCPSNPGVGRVGGVREYIFFCYLLTTCLYVSFALCHCRLPISHLSLSTCSTVLVLSIRNFAIKTVPAGENSLYQPPSSPFVSVQQHLTTNKANTAAIMCIKVIERYAVCYCVYYTHAVDPCPKYGSRDHAIRTKDILVGYTCSRHSLTGSQPSSHQPSFPDSGYSSGGYTQKYQGHTNR